MDQRYSVAREWCGYSPRRWVARFCGQWLGQDPTKSGAVLLCIAHADAREAALRDVTPGPGAARGGMVDESV